MSGTGFDYECSSLTPEGRLYQVEYAEKAVEQGSTSLGVVCKDGMILGTEKIVVNKMMLSGTDKRSYSITQQIGCVVNGIVPDGRALMLRGREEAAQYKQMFGINIPGRSIADRIALKAQMNTVYSSYRPYGSSIIFAAHDNMVGPSLWMVGPAGDCFQYYGCSSGRGRQLVRNEIEKTNFRELTVQEALPKIAKMLLKAQEEMKDKKQEIELGILCEETKWVHKILDRQTVDGLTATAKAEIEAEEDE